LHGTALHREIEVDAERAGLIVVAAGTGRRLGAERHKALVMLGGEPLVLHALRRLLTLPQLAPAVLVGHPDDRDALAGLLETLPRPVRLVDGGARRQDSVAAGLAALGEGEDVPEVVLVHDAARPFVPLAPLPALIALARELGAALLAVPLADTVKQACDGDGGRSLRTVPREDLRAAQTPQAFRRVELLRELARAEREGRSVTDEAGLFEVAGLDVGFVEGSPLNFKVTTQQDLRLAEGVLAAGSKGR
jgi:2-C-methyl-D-erythritol 4-phosphate cytidylyltransferase